MFNSEARRLLAGAVATVTAAILCLAGTAKPASATATPALVPHAAMSPSCSSSCYNVLAFGANPNGIGDNTAAFRAAIEMAQSNALGGTVYVPTGTYAFTQVLNGLSSISIRSGPKADLLPPVLLEGDGAATTSLVEHVGNQPLLRVGADGSTVEGLTLNAQSYGGGPDLTVQASNTTVTSDSILGANKIGVIGHGAIAPFALNYPGPPGALPKTPTYDDGNTISDTTIEDGINNDGFSFSFQSDATISDITHFGSRLALYVDKNVNVTNYTYTPNPACEGAENGFYISAPSSDIVIKNFTTYGEGGAINGPVNKKPVVGTTIENEQFMSANGNHLEVGNVNGLTIDNSSLNSGNTLLLNPNRKATGIIIENSTIPNVVIQSYQPGINGYYSQLTADFDDDTFPDSSAGGSTFAYPTPSSSVGPATFNIDGGSWTSPVGGFYSQPAANVTFNVTNLAPIPVAKPTISPTTAVVGDQLTGTNGEWLPGQTPPPTYYTYQWDDRGVSIPKATSNTYTPTAPGSYSISVTAHNPSGFNTVESLALNVT